MGAFLRRVRWKRVLVVVGLLAVLASVPWVWVRTSSAPYRHTAAEVPEAPVALVLGAGIRNGRPTPFLAGRLDVAADLYHRGKVEVLLVSGDNSTPDYDEPTAMRTYLIGRGVPERAVVADYAGLDTWDSCTRAKRVFGVRRATVVTQEFHLPRAVALCRSAGLEAFGVGHETSRAWAVTTAYGHFREAVASIKAVWDGLVAKPDPRFLGPEEDGVTRALRD
ncbi:SanA/YdcF family protein [Saccharothrix coeruleofusca]|uniref:Membrane protein n=1 Tax=Saccharothrix coeruleofusca TaxID=33919 RepID=A0A918AIX3_9PSEU|nr:ElyC/SanA/YdcF family protein [Saccharothrix coeruleofusca]MBP2334029.1 vancomycin permeability regulator SanA [Saccharothrix coeruleofusca]GGP43930.1 membrane protein [Saccharothrix coeruleofusca]